jgi:DNA invertase Pin-like site-specific DNA recombinase
VYKCTCMNIGYCRVSTQDQNLELQLDELKRAGCDKIFQDVASGSKDERKGLQEAMSFAREGDCLVIWKLDRLSRSLRHLIDTVNQLKERGIGLKILTMNLDTTTPSGTLIFHIFASLSEFERELIRERTVAGLKAARARGRIGGRPKAMDEKKVQIAKSLYSDGKTTVSEICKTLQVSKATLYRSLKGLKTS